MIGDGIHLAARQILVMIIPRRAVYLPRTVFILRRHHHGAVFFRIPQQIGGDILHDGNVAAAVVAKVQQQRIRAVFTVLAHGAGEVVVGIAAEADDADIRRAAREPLVEVGIGADVRPFARIPFAFPQHGIRPALRRVDDKALHILPYRDGLIGAMLGVGSGNVGKAQADAVAVAIGGERLV